MKNCSLFIMRSSLNTVRCSLFIVLCVLFTGCYTFKGFSIDPNVQTFYISNFTNKASLAPASLGQDFSERFRNRVRDEARLKFNDTSPDVEFSGTISDYRITTEAPLPGEGSSINVLTIVVNVEHSNSKNEKANYKKDFSFQRRFDASANLSSIQDDLNKQMINEIITNIFNDTFNNW